jgi:hypothetical protein
MREGKEKEAHHNEQKTIMEEPSTFLPSSPDSNPPIRWIDTGSCTIRPTLCTISATQEAFSFLFTDEPLPLSRSETTTIHSADRVIASPYLAKHVARLLNQVIDEYEGRFGSLEPVEPKFALEPFSILHHSLERPLPEGVTGSGEILFQLVTALDSEARFEPSFKVTSGVISHNRFLLAARHRDDDGFTAQVRDVCETIGMPKNFLETFFHQLPDANHIYFGFEESGTTSLHKVYLEFRDKIEERIKGRETGLETYLLHLGFKWASGESSRQVITRYEWFPSLPVQAILGRLPMIMDLSGQRTLLDLIEIIIKQASERISEPDIQYLEVAERENPRKSFDINLYKAKVQMEEIYPVLSTMMDYFGIPYDRFQALYEKIRTKRLGHIAGGIDREGRDFVSVYYGVEGTTGRGRL